MNRKVQSVQLTPSCVGACSIIADAWVSCTLGVLSPGTTAVVRVEVKALSLEGGLSQVLTATASATANEPDAKPQNNKDTEGTLIKK